MKHTRALLTHHLHVMVDMTIYAQIVMSINNEEIYFPKNVLNFSSVNLKSLIQLINGNHILLEETPYNIVDISEVFEKLELFKNNIEKQNQLLEKAKEVSRINTKIYDYDHAIEEASKLKLLFNCHQITFRDCLDLVIINRSNIKHYITRKRDLIKKLISENHNEFNILKDIELHDIDSFMNFIEIETNFMDLVLQQELIRVFTPKGESIALKKGSTVVDFAYKIHTSLGNKCAGAKIVSLYSKTELRVTPDQILQDGDKVTIIKRADGKEYPDLLWCKFVETEKANDKIRSFWNREHTKNGNLKLKKEFGDCYLSGNKFQYIAHHLKCGSVEELQKKLGSGEIKISAIRKKEQAYNNLIFSQNPLLKKLESSPIKPDLSSPPILGCQSDSIQISTCCCPMPGSDPIIGAPGKNSIQVHLKRCSVAAQISLDKKISLQWNCEECTAFMQIKAIDREDILRGILNEISSNHINIRTNVVKVNPASRLYPSSEYTTIIDICVRFNLKTQIDELKKSIEEFPDVIQVKLKKIFPGIEAYCSPYSYIKI